MKRFFTLLAVTFSFILFTPANSYAFNPFGKVDCSSASGSAVCDDGTGTTNPITGSNGVVLNVVNIIAFVAGAAAVIIIILSGFRFITSAGSSESVAGARRGIIYALVGLVVIFLARFIIAYILARI